jgi:hypothetical protein
MADPVGNVQVMPIREFEEIRPLAKALAGMAPASLIAIGSRCTRLPIISRKTGENPTAYRTDNAPAAMTMIAPDMNGPNVCWEAVTLPIGMIDPETSCEISAESWVNTVIEWPESTTTLSLDLAITIFAMTSSLNGAV